MTQSYVVIGTYGGVGEALCRRLVQGGARVLMAGRDAKRLAQLAADVGGETFALDATSTGEVEACLRRAVEVFGRVDARAPTRHRRADHSSSSGVAVLPNPRIGKRAGDLRCSAARWTAVTRS